MVKISKLMDNVQSMLHTLYLTKLNLTFTPLEQKEDDFMRKQAIEKIESAMSSLLNIITEINLTLIGFNLDKEKIKSMLNKAYIQTAAAFGNIPQSLVNDWITMNFKAFEILYNEVLNEVR